MSNIDATPKELKSLTRAIRLVSFLKVPLLAFCWPRVVKITSQVAEVSLPRNWLTSNHVGSMYFGALAMGAELSTALRLLQRLKNENLPLNFIFKDANFEFLKRAEGNVIFRVDEVEKVDALIEEALKTGERAERKIAGKAFLDTDPNTSIMTYAITLTVKKSRKGVL